MVLKKQFLPLYFCLSLILTACQSGETPATASFRTLHSTQAVPREALFQEPAATPYIQKTRQGLILAYQGLHAGLLQIFVRRSRTGHIWGDPVQVSHNSFSVTHPQLVEDKQGRLKLFFHSNERESWELYMSESSDATIWSHPQPVNLPDNQISDSSVLYTQQEYLLCYQTFGGGLYLVRSKDGKSWSKPVLISASGEAPSLIQDHKGNYLLAYEGSSETGWTIYVQSSRDLKSWSPPQALGQGKRSRWGRLVSSTRGTVLVFSSQEEDGAWELYKRQSTDLLQWSSAQALTQNHLRNSNAQLIAATENSAYLTWEVGALESRLSHLSLQQLHF